MRSETSDCWSKLCICKRSNRDEDDEDENLSDLSGDGGGGGGGDSISRSDDETRSKWKSHHRRDSSSTGSALLCGWVLSLPLLSLESATNKSTFVVVPHDFILSYLPAYLSSLPLLSIPPILSVCRGCVFASILCLPDTNTCGVFFTQSLVITNCCTVCVFLL